MTIKFNFLLYLTNTNPESFFNLVPETFFFSEKSKLGLVVSSVTLILNCKA